MSVFHRLAAVISPALRGGIAGLTWILAIVLIAQVVFRYGLDASLVWGEEFGRYAMVLLVFLGAIPLVAGQRLSAFASVGPGGHRGLAFLGGLVRLAFYIALGISAALLIQRSGAQRSIALGWPMALVYAPMLVFSGVAAVITLLGMAGIARPGKPASRDGEAGE
ncbi:TRAP transporter small permease [uncultured Tistrella sp.]|uniref:TRAP transporter small permease n=1 Tax=Tistrella mobilis TaxID=171437 RepID=UPI000C099080|nr:TRAP transporter small permease subunit [uncultured Tistrella sp.]MAM72424.1 hypothetical protein [Tistrella sp.]